jgi:polyribonucleotide nucleotidyltransferase
MDAAISAPRDEVSVYAPRIVTVQIKPDKVRDIIGPGGKTIRAIQEQTGAQIDINDNGTVSIASADAKSIEQAQALISGLTMEPEVGQFYNGIVKKIVEIGAFVEIMPGTDGLLHISEVAKERIRSVEDVLSEGDEVVVKCIKVDRDGKIRRREPGSRRSPQLRDLSVHVRRELHWSRAFTVSPQLGEIANARFGIFGHVFC